MGTDHPRDKQARLNKPSLWIDKPATTLSRYCKCLRGDESSWNAEHTEDDCSLLEENLRL